MVRFPNWQYWLKPDLSIFISNLFLFIHNLNPYHILNNKLPGLNLMPFLRSIFIKFIWILEMALVFKISLWKTFGAEAPFKVNLQFKSLFKVSANPVYDNNIFSSGFWSTTGSWKGIRAWSWCRDAKYSLRCSSFRGPHFGDGFFSLLMRWNSISI